MSDATDASEAVDEDLYRRARALLEPGDIELVGLVVDTAIDGTDEPTLHEATLEMGNVIAEHAGHDPGDTYVYSGNDDSEFGVNQHQGRTLDGDAFVWECQQLLRENTFDVVFYYEADIDQEAVVETVREAGYDVVGVETE